ncbi:MAG TPA: hypothetical protein DCX07_13390, partial [Phycisphaerales bacterium]|nr:hypothetical protein [Phycisphaerales bacterium]
MHSSCEGAFPWSVFRKQTVRIALCAILAAGATNAAGQVRSRMSSATPAPTLLVNSDEELAGYLAKAEALIAEKQYEQAINILQPLILRSDSGFLPIASDNKESRFVSLHLKASELIGRMDAEGLALYRGLYDAQAKQLYDEAVASGDEGLLRRIVYRYLHTSAGPAALDRLGAIHFDHGRFEEAAGAWRRALSLRAEASAEVRGVLL